MSIKILAIESSCDDTSASVVIDGVVHSNIIASQDVHKKYGGVVPELASRSHQQNIVPVVSEALKQAGVSKENISAVAFTRGPGLLGSLLVGSSFAKGYAMANKIPLIEVNHLQAHVHANFIQEKDEPEVPMPRFPFLCLLVSGGHTQILLVKDYLQMEILGETIDDAAGEAFDKCAKVIGLSYPGGPIIDRHAKLGDRDAFTFSKPSIPDFNFSFSGLKTSFLYFIRDSVNANSNFVEENLNHICASIQKTIVEILLDKFEKASVELNIKEVVIAGGVSANSELRSKLVELGGKYNWNVYLPKLKYTTDNAAMIGLTGYHKFLKQMFSDQGITPLARYSLQDIS